MKNWDPTTSESSCWLPKGRRFPLTAVELCCGMGAIGLGLRALGIRIVKAYDSWEKAVAIYNHNAPEPVAERCDLTETAARRRVISECRRLGHIDLLAAGPPCKGFSQLVNGSHHLPNPHNRVLEVIPQYVAGLRPRLVLIENVPDLVRHADGRTLTDLMNRLEMPGPRGLRYRVEWQIYDSSLYGTPQARKRILILGIREGAERLPPPGPDASPLYTAIRRGGRIPSALGPYLQILQDEWDARMVSAMQALSDLPLLGPGEEEIERPYASEPKSAYQQVMRQGSGRMLSNTRTPAVLAQTLIRLRHVPPGGCAHNIPEVHLRGFSRRFGSAYRRLHPHAPATTLSTKYDCAYHYACDRSLSAREYARIQGIPDFVQFPKHLASRRNVYEMIGNSVPPLLIRTVIQEALQIHL